MAIILGTAANRCIQPSVCGRFLDRLQCTFKGVQQEASFGLGTVAAAKTSPNNDGFQIGFSQDIITSGDYSKLSRWV